MDRGARWRWAIGWPRCLRLLFVWRTSGTGWRWNICCCRWFSVVLRRAPSAGHRGTIVAAAIRPGLPAPGLPAPGSPVASATSSESDLAEVHPDIPVLQRECDLARGRYSAASVEIEHLRESLQVVEVARGAIEEEARVARDAATDAQAHAFGEFCS